MVPTDQTATTPMTQTPLAVAKKTPTATGQTVPMSGGAYQLPLASALGQATASGASTTGATLPLAGQMPAPTGPASDTRPSLPLAAPQMAPAGRMTPPAAPTTATALPLATGGTTGGATSTPYANLTTTTPGSGADYTDKTITPGAGVDRLALATNAFDQFAQSSDPYYQKALRDANSSAGANGQLGSGQLRTSLGDAANNRQLQLDTMRSNLTNDAVSGSIEDQYRNIALAQQQQGFQAGQQQTAFGQEYATQQLQEALRAGDFARAAQLLSLGMAGNPSDTALDLSKSYGDQAGSAGQSAQQLLINSMLAGTQRQPGQLPSGSLPTGQQIIDGTSGTYA